MYGNLCTTGLIFWMLRNAVLDDQVEPGELHLLRLCPLAWLDAGQETVFERLPTQYGTVTVRFRPSADGSELTVTTSLSRTPASPRRPWSCMCRRTRGCASWSSTVTGTPCQPECGSPSRVTRIPC